MAKPINRTDNLSNGVEIPRSGGKVVLYSAGTGGIQKKRCMKCKTGMAVPTHLTNGTPAFQCQSCSHTFTAAGGRW